MGDATRAAYGNILKTEIYKIRRSSSSMLTLVMQRNQITLSLLHRTAILIWEFPNRI